MRELPLLDHAHPKATPTPFKHEHEQVKRENLIRLRRNSYAVTVIRRNIPSNLATFAFKMSKNLQGKQSTTRIFFMK
jgi:hypothetical protein